MLNVYFDHHIVDYEKTIIEIKNIMPILLPIIIKLAKNKKYDLNISGFIFNLLGYDINDFDDYIYNLISKSNINIKLVNDSISFLPKYNNDLSYKSKKV